MTADPAVLARPGRTEPCAPPALARADDGCPPVAVLTGVGVEVARTPVLRQVHLTLRAGEVLGLTGPNGSGKSTLLRVLATLLAPSAGTGVVLGAELGQPGCAAVRPQIGLLAHAAGLSPRLTLIENLRLIARLTGRHAGAAEQALAEVGLGGAAHRRVEQCSQGMVRRAELARLLMSEPRLLLLDEPHVGLDLAAAGLVQVLVGRCRAAGGAAVVVSHEPERLVVLADRVVEIVDGSLTATDPELDAGPTGSTP